MLFGSLSKLRSMHFYGARLSFTMEEPGRIREILTLYEALCRHADADVSAIFPNGSYTKGHLKRGVE
jgi:hypothetical protein